MRVHLVGEAATHEEDLRPHLEGSPEIVALPREAAHSSRYDEAIGPEDVVVTLRFTRPDRRAPAFRLLQVPGAGLDGVDLDALHPRTTVANVYEHETPIAEYVLARLLEWEIRAEELRASFTPGAWPELYRHRRPHGEVYGKSMGLVGYGRIGRAIATRAAAFGIRVTAVDDAYPGPTGDDPASRVLPTDRLPEVLAESDYLVLACPLTPATTGLIDATALARLPRHAVLVNTSRAPIVDEDALYRALRDGWIGGAVLDVWYRYPSSSEDETPPADRPFWELPHAWCTPHSSAWTGALSRRRYAVIAENINRFASGRPPRNIVRAGTQEQTLQ
ncbi:2-hydroxyacid dehydrogenase [Streptomyces sp. NPDC005438]|uniref:2-hydroxyacid dehydrogenase n=1 Tax=Streptomyces sp. NPDC005438 TaxID=3156880 RepID=UPI0033B2DBCE